MGPVSANKDGIRSNLVPASSDLDDWLLLVVTGLGWLHGAGLGVRDLSVYHGPPSKVQGKALICLRERSVNFSTNVEDQWRR